MIKISVDESYAYDLLSIAEIKDAKRSSDQTRYNIARILHELWNQIDLKTHYDILVSPEYIELKQANQNLFDIFDEMKRPDKTECYDLKADRLNYRRHECKIALQKRFFPHNPLTEVKLGYEKVV